MLNVRMPTVKEFVRRAAEAALMAVVVYLVMLNVVSGFGPGKSKSYATMAAVAYMVYALFVQRSTSLPVVSPVVNSVVSRVM